jgi:hypothetical protein
MLQWLRRRGRLAERLPQADAEALIRDHGAEARSRHARSPWYACWEADCQWMKPQERSARIGPA